MENKLEGRDRHGIAGLGGGVSIAGVTRVVRVGQPFVLPIPNEIPATLRTVEVAVRRLVALEHESSVVGEKRVYVAVVPDGLDGETVKLHDDVA